MTAAGTPNAVVVVMMNAAETVLCTTSTYTRTLAELAYVWASGKEHADDAEVKEAWKLHNSYSHFLGWLYDMCDNLGGVAYREWRDESNISANLDWEWC
jgi:hypothetical protein